MVELSGKTMKIIETKVVKKPLVIEFTVEELEIIRALIGSAITPEEDVRDTIDSMYQVLKDFGYTLEDSPYKNQYKSLSLELK